MGDSVENWRVLCVDLGLVVVGGVVVDFINFFFINGLEIGINQNFGENKLCLGGISKARSKQICVVLRSKGQIVLDGIDGIFRVVLLGYVIYFFVVVRISVIFL